MNIAVIGGNETSDLSGDFSDALYVAENDLNYANKTNNSNNNNNHNSDNNNANILPRQSISSQCSVEEQERRLVATGQMLAQRSQAAAHHMAQTAYQQQFQNQFLSQQQQQQLNHMIHQQQIQQQRAAKMHQSVPQMLNQVDQTRQIVSQMRNQLAQVRETTSQMPHQAAQAHQTASQLQNQLVQVCQTGPQIQNQLNQVRQSVPPIQNQSTQVRQTMPQIKTPSTQVLQSVSQIQNQTAQAHQASFLQSQTHQQNRHQQIQLQNQQSQQSLTQYQQQLLAGYQQLYGSSSQVQNQQQRQQQIPRNFAPQVAQTVCTAQSNYQMIPQQQPLQPKVENTIQQNKTVVQQAVSEPSVKIPQSSPHVEIIEQPAARGARFRYGCEVRPSGSIPGVNSTPGNRTYPTIRVVGYDGDAVVVVSCVTAEEPYRAHPHNLVGKGLCYKGVGKATMSKDNMTVVFDKFGIQCVKKKDVANSLMLREKIRVDPFKNGFEGKGDPGSFDQNCVRLAFQVYLEGPTKGQYKILLPPVVSDPIYDKKSSPDLTIYRLSHCSASATGGAEIILLCDKVAKENIQVRFYEERDDELVWEGFGILNRTNAVHKHVAITFQCPNYRMTDFTGVANVHIELVRPSDGMCSHPVQFFFIPDSCPDMMKKKRKRIEGSLKDMFLMKNLENIVYASQWNIMNQPNDSIIEAR